MSNQNVTTHKFAIVLNKKVEIGKILNVIGHLSLGLAAFATPEQKEAMGFINYTDKDGNNHPHLSKNSYVMLRADNANQIRIIRNAAIAKNISFLDFTNTMQEGTYLEQLERTKITPEIELEYYGIVLFGTIPEISELTKKFSLWR